MALLGARVVRIAATECVHYRGPLATPSETALWRVDPRAATAAVLRTASRAGTTNRPYDGDQKRPRREFLEPDHHRRGAASARQGARAAHVLRLRGQRLVDREHLSRQPERFPA